MTWGSPFMRLQSDGRWGSSHLEGSFTHESELGRLKHLGAGTAGASEASLSCVPSPAWWLRVAILLTVVLRALCLERASYAQAVWLFVPQCHLCPVG